MENEKISIVDEERRLLGTATRGEVHNAGHWHETFHCWFIENRQRETFLYFQLRSLRKKQFPGLLDITAAGHILAHETVEDGVREVREELGVSIDIADLIQGGIIKTSFVDSDWMDNEFCHVFFYEWDYYFEALHLQEEEVSGIFRAKKRAFQKLLNGETAAIQVEGFEVREGNRKTFVERKASKSDFVPNLNGYYEKILQQINEIF